MTFIIEIKIDLIKANTSSYQYYGQYELLWVTMNHYGPPLWVTMGTMSKYGLI